LKLKKLSVATIFATILLTMMVFQPLPTKAVAQKGPRTENLIVYFYGSVEAAYAALFNDEIDAVGYEITADLVEAAAGDPNLCLAPVADSGMYEFDVNNNWTIADYPGVRSPTTYLEFRQALARLTNLDKVSNVFCGGFAEPIYQTFAAPHKGWANQSMWGINYPYPYNPLQANILLDSIMPNSSATANLYYDAAFPGSTTTLRTYPAGHSKAGQDLDPVKMYIRTDDLRRYQAGLELQDFLRKSGVPVDPFLGPSSDTGPFVMTARNYHIYTGGWSLGRFPPLYHYGLLHSVNWFPDGSNYITGMNASNLPNYPDLDNSTNWGNYAITYAQAAKAAKITGGLEVEYAVHIPLFSARSYWVYRSDVLGVVNFEGSGIENGYSFMNMFKTSGDTTTMRYGIKTAPYALNIITSQWFYDYQCLDRINWAGGPDVAPYDLSYDQGGFITDWEVTTWDDGGETKTLVKQWCRDDNWFVEPGAGGGSQTGNVNSSVYFFSLMYGYAIDTGWNWDTWKDVHHIDITSTHSWDIYFDSLSYWHVYRAGGYLLPYWTWLQSPLAAQTTLVFQEGVNLTTPGFVGLTKPVWFESVNDGAELVLGTDYNWVQGDLYISKDLAADTVLTVDFWYTDNAWPVGYHPGTLPWDTILEGCGMYYPTALTTGTGGSMSMVANRFFWMETPLLGDIDFKYSWIPGPKPRDGAYKIDIFDVVMAAGAYGSSGSTGTDAAYISGADLAPAGCTIDIFDIVTITGDYDASWGGYSYP
jgi:hypothetical protein